MKSCTRPRIRVLASTPPARKCTAGVSLTQAAKNGFWWCSTCRAPSEPTEETIGEPWQKCARCGDTHCLAWNPPAITDAREGSR